MAQVFYDKIRLDNHSFMEEKQVYCEDFANWLLKLAEGLNIFQDFVISNDEFVYPSITLATIISKAQVNKEIFTKLLYILYIAALDILPRLQSGNELNVVCIYLTCLLPS